MFKNLESNLGALQPKAEPTALPVINIPASAGLEGEQRLVVQVAMTFWKGKVTGAYPNTANSNLHRLEVSRMCTLEEYQTDEGAQAAMKAALGRKDEDTWYRPERRTTLIMNRRPPAGLPNLKPWVTAYAELTRAITTLNKVVAETKKQHALLLVVDASAFSLTVPGNTRYEAYEQASITAVLGAEAIRLDEPETLGDSIEAFAGDQDADVMDYAEA